MNNRINSILIALLLFMATGQMTAQQRQYLHDGWSFGMSRMPNRYAAVVPGVVHTDLMRAGLIVDPRVGLNERSVQWVDKEDWIYETTFDVADSLLASSRIDICFDGLDTYADVYLNDKKILEADNMFCRWRADVKEVLKPEGNTLRVYFHSPVKIDMPKWEQHPHLYGASNDQSENGGLLDRKISVFARKAGYHYGWDWGPRLVTSGIWRSVFLEAWNDVRIADTYFCQHEVSKQKAIISDVVEIESCHDIPDAEISVACRDNGRIVATKRCALQKGMNTIPVEFTIKSPRLWWCKGMGSPNLYTFSTAVTVRGREVAEKSTRIGVRSVRLVTEPDADGNQQFYFVLNGIPVFAKGTNYIPQDNFLPDVTPERYRQTLHDALAANMNMIRVWGGGVYEDDIFYDMCDELGLMVWQDFMFACSTYPAEGAWLECVRREAVDNIRRLRNHASIVLWCGGNECMDAWYNWGWKHRMEQTNPEGARLVEQQQEYLYYDFLQHIADQYIPDNTYITGSPLAARGRGGDGVNGDRHFYGVGHRRMPVSSYNQEKAHFFSEYGMQSFPEHLTVMRFASDPTQHDISSELMMSRQRGGAKANEVIKWYIDSEYGQPKDFQQFLYVSQLLQADAMRTAIESHRRNMPHCMGTLLWQHNDCWPAISWSTRDYYGRWKAAHYMVRQAFKPLICSAILNADSLQVYAISDLQRRQRGVLRLSVYTLDGQLVNTHTCNVAAPAATSAVIHEQPLATLLKGHRREDVVLNMHLATSSGITYDNNVYLCLPKDLRLSPVKPEVTIKPAEGGYSITLRADRVIRALAITVDDSDSWLDNNYFDVLPGIPVDCFLRTTLSAEEVQSKLRFFSMNNLGK